MSICSHHGFFSYTLLVIQIYTEVSRLDKARGTCTLQSILSFLLSSLLVLNVRQITATLLITSGAT